MLRFFINYFGSYNFLSLFFNGKKTIGVIIEEITEEVQASSSRDFQGSPSERSASRPQQTNSGVPLQALKDDPESIRFIYIHQ